MSDQPKTSPSNSDIRAFWLKHGGQFHGPIVEHVTMTEAKFYPLMRAFAAEVAAAERERCAQIFDARAAKTRADAESVHMTDTQGVGRQLECARLIRELASG